MRNELTKKVALGGLLVAVAIVIMCLGGLIPLATFICPMLCALIQFVVLRFCGKKLAWAWYGAVSILSILLAPDKEAAYVFVLLGYYPIMKPWLDRCKLSWLWKLLYFNGAVLLLYAVALRILGLNEVMQEYEALGTIGLVICLLLANATFLLLDKLLTMLAKRTFKRTK